MSEREQLKKWVDDWKKTGEFLENLRREKLRKNINTSQSIQLLDSAFRSALIHRKPSETSGLVEFQRLIGKQKNDD